MARREYITLVDDFNGSEGAARVEFMLDGIFYEIDLDDANNTELRNELAKYIAAARSIRKTRRTLSLVPNTGKSKSKHHYQSAARKRQNSEIREWARFRGYDVPSHGRIPADIRKYYFNAHKNVVEVTR